MPTHDDHDDGLAQIIRLPEAPLGPGHAVRRGPGRPRKIEPIPDTAALEHHAEAMAARMKHLDTDELVRATKGRADARDVVRIVVREIAREAASLEFQEGELAQRGRDTAQVSSRRIDALKKIAEIELKLREMDTETINLSSEQVTKLFRLWVERLMEVAVQVLPEEIRNVYMELLAVRLKDFEKEAEAALR